MSDQRVTAIRYSPDVDDRRRCRECFRLWKRSMGAQLAKAIFDEAPESVRKWIYARAAK